MSDNSAQVEPGPNPRVAWEGCSVLLDINGGDRLVFACLSPASTLKFGNKNCLLQPLAGCNFGSLFQVESGEDGSYFSRIVSNIKGINVQEDEVHISKEESRDNRAIIDNNQAQSLTGEDIEAMRREGASGNDIIEALIANNATFEKKTQFSQEKYRIKKQKKYTPRVLLRRPTARSICEAYFRKNPAKIGYLRMDSLSLLLSMSNVTANSDILVVDMVGGLLTGAVAERLGGTGCVCSTYLAETPYPIDIVRILRTSLNDLNHINNNGCVQILKDTNVNAIESPLNEQTSSSVNMEGFHVSTENAVSDIVPETTAEGKKPNKTPKAGVKASEEIMQHWKQNGFSGLIVAAPEQDSWSLLKDLLPLLSYSTPFAIYHQYLQPLTNCMHNLQMKKMAISLQISEPWLREYQVLPSRTHPCMQMSGTGGYILSGIRTYSSENGT